MRNWLFAGLILSFTLITVQSVFAESLSIEGNGQGTQNSIQLNSTSNNSVQQHNTATIKTTVDANANTGGNSANGNKGNTTIKTGDSEVNINVTNTVNQNSATVGCCGTPTPSKKPLTPTPTQTSGTPTPTSGSGNNPTNNNSNSGNGGSNNNSGGIGGGSAGPEILGLAATSGTPITDTLFYIAGTLCLGLAARLARQRALHG